MKFSLAGLLISLAILAPNLLMILLPPKEVPSGAKDAGPVFTILERLGQAGCFVLPMLVGASFNGRALDLWFVLMAFCVMVYWALWVRYATNGRGFRLLFEPVLGIPMPMAVFPVLAFGFAAAWGRSVWLGAAVIALAIGHLANSWRAWKAVRASGNQPG